jgi:alkanesulfonate monooxygenase SsuD/methylene tetrahydromethanopterin reductase-like flavin-dependent oxidoreductase (luciferase family)
LRALWTNELATFDGEFHTIDRIGLNPMPVQRPIPIWMGSFVGKIVEKVLERAARLADGWMPQYPPGDELVAALERLRKYAVAAGRDPASIGIECGVRIKVGDDPDKWLADAVAYQAIGATHLRVSSMGGGFGAPAEHLAAWNAWHRTVRPGVEVSPPRV